MGLPEYVDSMKWELAYWEWMAKNRKRLWLTDRWALTLGEDELNRRTLVVGPVVVALWHCRCVDCRADEQVLLDIIDREEGA